MHRSRISSTRKPSEVFHEFYACSYWFCWNQGEFALVWATRCAPDCLQHTFLGPQHVISSRNFAIQDYKRVSRRLAARGRFHATSFHVGPKADTNMRTLCESFYVTYLWGKRRYLEYDNYSENPFPEMSNPAFRTNELGHVPKNEIVC
jgi:hypothetical protein